ncbi:MAG: mycothiol synthase [Actinobacteria bacterium]|nr:mycothiol synthase [Actinomycetota bacterium]
MSDGRLRRGRDWWDLDPATAIERPEALAGELRALASAAAATPEDGELRWVVSQPTTAHDRVARAAAAAGGAVVHRDLVQLRRPLPVGAHERTGLPAPRLRSFRPGVDEDAWLEVNRRAFAGHPDQGRTTRAELDWLESQPWFDPDGFLVLDGDGEGNGGGERAARMDGFCWTKLHADHDPPLGEIFVIGVDPGRHGERLGPALTIAGLDHLHDRRGAPVGMLYVEASNLAAMRMYERLGFEPHHRDRVYVLRSPVFDV